MPWDDYSYYKPSRPRQAKGGIKSQSKQGAFGKNWWAKRWIQTLESFNIGARLGRGKSYARQGQVLSIEIEKGLVTAKVQGSRARPYKVTITVTQLSDDNWAKAAEALSSQARFTAKLLAGEMPEDIEEAFDGLDFSLFPQKLKDLDTDCSCPDWSNPCKHIAAVYYLLGEEFDRDPFLIFKLRGIDREELTGLLHGQSDEQSHEEQAPPEPLPTDPSTFWEGTGIPDGFLGDVRTPPVPAALPKRLGGFPFWRGETPLIKSIEPIYETSSQAGLELILKQSA